MNVPLDLPLRGSHLIEASAGTGKTFTIALVYVRQILGHLTEAAQRGLEAPDPDLRALLPPDILVVTFTEAAAAELRERIRARLVEAAAVFGNTGEAGEEDPLLVELRSRFPETFHPHCRAQLELAAEWMDEAAISTIHGWALRMLRDHAFDSGSLFDQTLVTDARARVHEAVLDYWRLRFGTRIGASQAKALRRMFPNGPADLIDRLDRPLKRPDAVLTYVGEKLEGSAGLQMLGAQGQAVEAIDVAERAVRKAFVDDREGILSRLEDARDLLSRAKGKFPDKNDDAAYARWIDELVQWSQGSPATSFVRKLAPGRKPLNGKDYSLLDHPFFAALDAWDQIEAQERGDRDRLRAMIIADAAETLRERLDDQVLERAELGFDDMLRQLDAALDGERLRQRIREQFPVAMIDEFQDTDPVQYAIFDRIYAITANRQDGGILLIGDPKQAIYSFRGADVHTYLQARAAVAERRHPLGINFRSTQSVVDGVNALFERASRHGKGAFGHRSPGDTEDPIPYEQMKANGRKERLELPSEASPGLVLRWFQTDDFPSADTHRTVMAARAAEDIATWLTDPATGFVDEHGQKRPVLSGDIAVLVRQGDQARAMREALAERGIGSVYLSERGSVFETDEAWDVLAWLRACAEPTEASRLREALASRSLDLSLIDLEALGSDEAAWEREVARFLALQALWRRSGVLAMLRKLLFDFDVPRRLLAQPDGDRRLTDLMHLGEWAQRADAAMDAEHALVQALAAHIADPPQDEEVRRLESDQDLVQIITIHKSKGLEYPIVLVPFASHYREVSGKDPDALLHAEHEGQQRTMIELAPRPRSQGDDRPKEMLKQLGEIWGRAEEERLQEDLRLLYVAVTRARHLVSIGVAPLAPGNNSKPQLHRSALGYVLSGGSSMESSEAITGHLDELASQPGIALDSFKDTDAHTTVPPRETVGVGEIRPLVARHAAFPPWWIASFSALLRDGLDPDDAPEVADDLARDEASGESLAGPIRTATGAGVNLHDFPAGAEPGVLLHDLIEWCGARGFHRGAGDDAAKAFVERRSRSRGWARHAPRLQQWLAAFLDQPLPLGDDNPCVLGQLQHYRCEQAFLFSANHAEARALDDFTRAEVLPGQSRPRLTEQRMNGLVSGFIDLVIEHDGRYWVLDWKSNRLGDDDAAYTEANMAHAFLDKRYDVQLALYLLALHRHLRERLGEDYDPAQHIGGGAFVFLRGLGGPARGVLQYTPSAQMLASLDALFRSDKPGRHAA